MSTEMVNGMAINRKLKDESGNNYGKWNVISQKGNYANGGALWECKCECGSVAVVSGGDLRSGKSTQCKECSKKQKTGRALTHGGSVKDCLGKRSRLYRIWRGMKTRCGNPNSASYENYGGKGIQVCEEWLAFKPFQEWSMANGYDDNLSIDRINCDLGYSPFNCRWATKEEQSRNRGAYTAKRHDGVLWMDVAVSNGIKTSTYRNRLHEGWSYEDASSLPLGTPRLNGWRNMVKRNDKGQFQQGAVIL